MNYLMGIDIGNAKTEIAYMVDGELKYVTQPSAIAKLSKKISGTDLEEKEIVSNLLDNMHVNFISKEVKADGNYFVGSKAMSYSNTVQVMPIETNNKSTNDIPIIASMSMVASIALQDHYKTNANLPSELKVSLKMATAIPSSEYDSEDKLAKFLEARFLQEHQVNIYVGNEVCRVFVTVTECKVTEEGRTAMLAFFNSDSSILKNYNETYKENKVPKDFMSALTLHADIGDGTSEIVYTEGPNPVPNGSKGIRTGVGHATYDAIDLYKEDLDGKLGRNFERQHFMKALQQNNERGKMANRHMENSVNGQAFRITELVEDAFVTRTNSSAEYIFVHGGGSVVFKNAMYNHLMDFADKVFAQVVWIPEEFATHMNSTGTFHLAKAIFNRK